MTEGVYAGDMLPKQAWEKLASDPNAVMVDCRTAAEWAYVGIADLEAVGKSPIFVPWLNFPDMKRNPTFVEDVAQQVPDKNTTILFLCRSGQRSKGSAVAMTAAGYEHCYNVACGFEGDKDAFKHRGTVNGWKVDGLAWMQG